MLDFSWLWSTVVRMIPEYFVCFLTMYVLFNDYINLRWSCYNEFYFRYLMVRKLSQISDVLSAKLGQSHWIAVNNKTNNSGQLWKKAEIMMKKALCHLQG